MSNSVSHSAKAANIEPDWVLIEAVNIKDKETVLIYNVMLCVNWLHLTKNRDRERTLYTSYPCVSYGSKERKTDDLTCFKHTILLSKCMYSITKFKHESSCR